MDQLTEERVRIRKVEVLSKDWHLLRKTTFDLKRRDGSWITISRETYDRGNGATVLLFNRQRKTVILTRQFRFPAFGTRHNEMLIEACAGLLDEHETNPETCIRRELEEETGYTVRNLRKIFEAFMSPGSVTEILHFFVGEYADSDRIAPGGGLASDTEEIDVIELKLDDALSMICTGQIVDGKTIILLQYATLNSLCHHE